MTKETVVFVLGFLTVVVPQLGVPDVWKNYFLVCVGVLLMILGYRLRRAAYVRSIERDGERNTDSFVESRPIQPESDTNL